MNKYGKFLTCLSATILVAGAAPAAEAHGRGGRIGRHYGGHQHMQGDRYHYDRHHMNGNRYEHIDHHRMRNRHNYPDRGHEGHSDEILPRDASKRRRADEIMSRDAVKRRRADEIMPRQRFR